MSGDGVVIGLDLGGTKMHAAAVDAAGGLLGSQRDKTLADEGADAVIARMAALVDRVRQDLGALAEEVRAICVGVPGGVDERTGTVDHAPNLGWRNVRLAEQLRCRLSAPSAPVFLDNDVRMAVLGEWAYGVGRGTRDLVGVFVGTGVGGGLVLGGELRAGTRGVAGELGHTPIQPHGPRCSCGRRGHVEALAGRAAMEREVGRLVQRGWKSCVPKLMKKAGTTRLTSSIVERALAEEDGVMHKVLADTQYYLGLLVAGVVNTIDPEVVVIGGGIAERLGETFVAPIRKHATKHFLSQRELDRVRVVPTELKEQAAPLGAALMARRRLRLDTTAAPSQGTPSWPAPSD
jgi:glucokinase